MRLLIGRAIVNELSPHEAQRAIERLAQGVTTTRDSVRYGKAVESLGSLFERFKGIEDEKVADVTEMLARNPTRRAVLLGDTVQADPAVYRRVMQAAPDRVELVLLHEVEGYPTPADLKRSPKVVVFADYSDAGRQLHARGLISDAQLDDVLHDR